MTVAYEAAQASSKGGPCFPDPWKLRQAFEGTIDGVLIGVCGFSAELCLAVVADFRKINVSRPA